MSANKTRMTDQNPEEFVAAIDHDGRRRDAETLLGFFSDVTGYRARMWGPSIIGYGRYHYVYASGREGDFLATGFSPRKANLSLYIMPGYQDYGDILARLGKHKLGKSCLYINKLAVIDMDVLAELLRAGLRDLNDLREVQPT